jgi:AraC-like DNA-binding protein
MPNQYEILIGEMKASVFYPAPELKPFIKSYTCYRNSKANHLSDIKAIPNGSVDLHFHFNNSGILFYREGFVQKVHNFFVGIYDLNHRTKLIPITENNCLDGLCISFTFPGMLKLLRSKPAEIANKIISVEDMWGNTGKQLGNLLEEAISDERRVLILNNYFISEARKESLKKLYGLTGIFEYLQNTTDKITVDRLAWSLNISYRTIHRKFTNEMGMCPKEYLRIVRFDKVCRMLRSYPGVKLSDIIYDCGYYDQAHFINDFTGIMKISPLEFLRKSRGNYYFSRSYTME